MLYQLQGLVSVLTDHPRLSGKDMSFRMGDVSLRLTLKTRQMWPDDAGWNGFFIV